MIRAAQSSAGWRTLEAAARAYAQLAGRCGLRPHAFRLTVSPLAVGKRASRLRVSATSSLRSPTDTDLFV
jgi:hypothetical protein